jgi:neopullulanase
MAVMTSTEMHTPEWVRDAVFYQIFPDRFAKSERVAKADNLEPWDSLPTPHGYKGGDLLGVVERLDYLEDLGVNALYFNPIFQSASNHRYHTHDYDQVDPMLGGNEALAELLNEAHARGMKVVLDGVFNHASRGFFQFSDILENGQKSPYLDWFHIQQFPLNAYGQGELGYAAWWNLPALPKFNTDTDMVREFLWRVGTSWLEFGIDGWRLDVPGEIDDDDFWREFRRRCRKVDPDCYLIGEIWDDARRWLRGDQFDAVMNYPLTRAVFGFVARSLNEEQIKRCGYRQVPRLSAKEFAAELGAIQRRYRPEVTGVQFNLLGSHDTPRIRTVLNGDETAVRMAFLLQMTLPGTPCIYYGDEIGLSGNNDPYCRQGMPWSHQEVWNLKLHTYLKDLIRLREENPALRRGRFKTAFAKGSLLVYARQDEHTTFLVAINTSSKQRKLAINLDSDVIPEGFYQSVRGPLHLELKGRHLTGLDVPAREGVLYRLV